MTKDQIRAAVNRVSMSKGTIIIKTTPKTLPLIPVVAVGGTTSPAMTQQEIQEVLMKVHGASGVTDVQDGTRVHLHYKSFGVPTQQAVRCASRATELGLSRDRYTGRVHRVWTSSKGDQCLTMWVELERDHMYRTLNLDRGEVYKFIVLGE